MSISLAGRRLLVIEDDFFIAEDLVETLRSEGADVIGPVGSIDGALGLLDETAHLDGAVLDVNLRGELAYPVADALLERAIPFTFATGYDQRAIPSRYRHIVVCEKPVNTVDLARALFG